MIPLPKDEIVRLARRVCHPSRQEVFLQYRVELEHFAALCRADLVAEIETLRYELDAVAEIKQERDALKADAERLRNDLAAMNNSFNALKSELDTANEPCAWCAGNR